MLSKLRFNKQLFGNLLSKKRVPSSTGNKGSQDPRKGSQDKSKRSKGAVFVEYLLLVTLVGFGVIVGLATLRSALVNELMDLANAINAINT